MNVTIPFQELAPDVQDALKQKCIKEHKTLQEIGIELLSSVLRPAQAGRKSAKKVTH